MFSKKNLCNFSSCFLQATCCSFSEDIHFLFEVAWYLLLIFQFQTCLLHNAQIVPLFDDDGDDEKTSSESVSDSANEVSRFVGGGIGALCFTGGSRNIERTRLDATFFFPLPKVVVRSSSWKWYSHTYILLFGFLSWKESAPLFLRNAPTHSVISFLDLLL